MNATRLRNTTLLLAFVFTILGISSANGSAAPDEDQVSSQDLVAWVRANAIPLDTLDSARHAAAEMALAARRPEKA